MKKEPDWLQAVEEEDLHSLASCISKKTTEKTTISGFFPHEIAHMLNKRKAFELLSQIGIIPIQERVFFIRKKGKEHYERFNQKEFEHFFSLSFSPTLFFQDIDLVKAVAASCPRIFRSFFTRNLFDAGNARRESIRSEEIGPVSIEWVDDRLGYGLFAREAIIEGTFIGEYTGEIIEVDHTTEKLNEYCAKYPVKLFSRRYFVIDASHVGNEMRFANHSYKPNLLPLYVIDRNIMHLAFIAERDIAPGEQLFINYGKDFWKKRNTLE